MPADTLVIVNPHSRAGATRRRWKSVEAKLQERLGSFEVEHTKGPRDAERIAREAVRTGVRRLIVAGGDGTASEAASGVLAAGLAKEAEIALLPLGTGGDLARTIGLPRELDAAIEEIAAGRSRRIDAGRIRYIDRQGQRRESYFLNVASMGVSGLVDQLVNGGSKRLGGSVSFLLGTLRAFASYRSQALRLVLDGVCIHEGPLMIAAAANGRYFGGGMHVAPKAALDNGELDVVIIGAMSKPALIANLHRLYRGTHESHPDVSMFRGRVLEAEASPGVLLDVDGEDLGMLPASIEVLPAAITIFGVSDPSEGH